MGMTWSDKYRYALYAAGTYNYEFARDIVHDAWIKYTITTGLDLFEVPIKNFKAYCFACIRRAFYSWYVRERKGPKYRYFDSEELASGLTAPDTALFAVDLQEVIEHRLIELGLNHNGNKQTNFNKARLEDVFSLKIQGYNATDIAQQLKVSNGLITRYTKKMSLVNPFRGNKLKITRTISKDTWDKKIDKDDYELDDYNEYFKLFRHKESGQGILIRLLR